MNQLLRVRPSVIAWTPLFCSLFCGVAWAQTPSPTEPSSSAPPPDSAASALAETSPQPASAPSNPVVTPEQRGPMHVTVTVVGYEMSSEAVATAIARDLGLSLTPDVNLARCRFLVEVERGKNLALTFHGSNGFELKRVVRAPEATADVSEVAALLAVNLVRDEAPELLPLLTSKPIDPKPTAKAEQPKAQPKAEVTPAPKTPPRLPFIPANATFVFPLTIMRDVDEHAVGFELGLVYSHVGAIDGAGINAVVLRTRTPSHGLLVAGAVSIAGQGAEGIQTEPALSGVQISGAASLAGGKVDGAQISGAASVAGGSVDGVQISGAASIASGAVDGAQVSGAANVSDDFEGLQAAGALNIASGNFEGAQISGAVNVAKDVDGTQISLVNIGKEIDGAQIGLVNIGGHVKGAQIGLLNIADEVDGASLGLVTYSRKGQTQITTWYDSTRPVNIGVRFVSGPLYALPSVGADPRDTGAFDVAFSLGARIPVQRLYFDIDANSRMLFDDGAYVDEQIDLRYRLTAGFEVTSWLGVFAGGGVHHYFSTNDTADQNLKPFWCLGVDLL